VRSWRLNVDFELAEHASLGRLEEGIDFAEDVRGEAFLIV